MTLLQDVGTLLSLLTHSFQFSVHLFDLLNLPVVKGLLQSLLKQFKFMPFDVVALLQGTVLFRTAFHVS